MYLTTAQTLDNVDEKERENTDNNIQLLAK